MRLERTALLVLVAIALLSACTYTVPMNTQMADLALGNQIPLRATLLIPDALRRYTFKGNPQSYTGSAHQFVFPLGMELERATHDAFSQVFQRVTVVREPPKPEDVEVLVEPEITNFHFRFDQLSYAGFQVAAVSKIQVKVTMTDGRTVVWAREAQSPEQRSGPWLLDFDFDERLGEAASKALVFTLREIALDASRASELWALADKVRTEGGRLGAASGIHVKAETQRKLPVAGSLPSTKREIVEGVPPVTLEDELQLLSDLKAHGKITEEEYVLLRKRLIETFPVGQPVLTRPSQEASRRSPQGQASAVRPTSPPAPGLPAQLTGLIGTWRGTSSGKRGFRLPTTMRIFRAGEQVRWDMAMNCASEVKKASGSATMSDDVVTFSGTYELCGYHPAYGYTTTEAWVLSRVKIKFSVAREGRTLDGAGLTADNRAVTFSLTKAKD